MGHQATKYRSNLELTPQQINILLNDAGYSEQEINTWYTKFIRNCPNRKLQNRKFIEAYIQFYEHGRILGARTLKLGDIFPNLYVKTTDGNFHLHEWIGNSWCILFSHPADFTPVCTTELSQAAKLKDAFDRRNVKCIALSCDSVEDHHEWIRDLQAYANANESNNDTAQCEKFAFPIIEDLNRELAKQLGMIDQEEYDSTGLPLTARAVFIIGPGKKLKASILYPASTGRNFDEILRLIDGLQLSARLPVATPVNWIVGDKVMIPSNVKDEDIKKHFPQGVEVQDNLPSGKKYIRMVQL